MVRANTPASFRFVSRSPATRTIPATLSPSWPPEFLTAPSGHDAIISPSIIIVATSSPSASRACEWRLINACRFASIHFPCPPIPRHDQLRPLHPGVPDVLLRTDIPSSLWRLARHSVPHRSDSSNPTTSTLSSRPRSRRLVILLPLRFLFDIRPVSPALTSPPLCAASPY